MKCKLNNKCEFGDLCKSATQHDSLTVLGCSSYKSKKPLTNEEWLKRCTTEQLADVLSKMTLSCYICGQDGVREDSRHCVFGKCTGKEDILEWLKQPNTKE